MKSSKLLRSGVLVLFSVTPFTSAFAVVPRMLEPDYAEAVIAYHAGSYDRTLEFLDKVTRVEPSLVEALELKALTLAAKKDLSAAVSVYERLLRLPEASSHMRATAFYHYELGRLFFQEGNYDKARGQLETSVKLGFNVEASHLFLGIADLKEKKGDTAREHFQKVLSGEIDTIKPAARLYLAQADTEMSDFEGMAKNYAEAREKATQLATQAGADERSKELALQVTQTADRELRNFDRSTLFASVGLSSGYDSNVLSVPSSVVTPLGGPSASSFVSTLSFGLGWASSPVDTFQFIPSYRGSLNYDANPNTKNGQFFSHDVTVYITKHPLELTNWGFKLEGAGALEYQASNGSGGAYHPYFVQGSLGPYFKAEIAPNWVVGADAFFQPQDYYIDTFYPPNLAQSGWGQVVRMFISRGTPRGLWNPGASLTGAYTRTDGEDYRGGRLTLDLGNTMYFSPDFMGAVDFSAGGAHYGARLSGARDDQTVAALVSAGYRVSSALTLLGNLQFLDNFTNVDAYRYDRLILSVGLNYLF